MSTTAHEQLRRTNPAKGYVAGSCNASMVAVTSDLGARPDKARRLRPPLWERSFQTFAGQRDALPMLPPGGRGAPISSCKLTSTTAWNHIDTRPSTPSSSFKADSKLTKIVELDMKQSLPIHTCLSPCSFRFAAWPI